MAVDSFVDIILNKEVNAFEGLDGFSTYLE